MMLTEMRNPSLLTIEVSVSFIYKGKLWSKDPKFGVRKWINKINMMYNEKCEGDSGKQNWVSSERIPTLNNLFRS